MDDTVIQVTNSTIICRTYLTALCNVVLKVTFSQNRRKKLLYKSKIKKSHK